MPPTPSRPADWTVVTRKDGGKQWAYKGKPVYTFKKDAKPGDVDAATASTMSGTSPRRKNCSA